MSLPQREEQIRNEALAGNAPQFWRKFVSVHVREVIDGNEHIVEYFVAPDYFCIGSDEDYFRAPIKPQTAQEIADKLGCVLPTPKMVDQIYAAAAVKLDPEPIPPSAEMTTVPVFARHNEMIQAQVHQRNAALGQLVAGHMKDVVITSRLTNAAGKVAIYGWHQPGGTPIQPLYLGHTSQWVDYSQGVRFVLREMTVDGERTTIEKVLADPKQCALLSNDGPILQPRYLQTAATNSSHETNVELKFDPGIRVLVNSPEPFETNKPIRLILYALPNGNTVEQTIGRKIKPGDDWHFDIQHIGAQTRWLREHVLDANIVVAYLECAEKAWPVWRRTHDPQNQRIPKLVEELRHRFPTNNLKIVMTGHSGGGSFTFGLIDGVTDIPNDIERIAFLDSNYAYDSEKGHAEKLLRWLKASNDHYLCVLAYEDSVALLNGKTFVSERGGTWGRSHAMLNDLGPFDSSSLNDEWERYSAFNGRVQFALKKNPTKAILHTVQIERNGFIHAMLAGAQLETKATNTLARAFTATRSGMNNQSLRQLIPPAAHSRLVAPNRHSACATSFRSCSVHPPSRARKERQCDRSRKKLFASVVPVQAFQNYSEQLRQPRHCLWENPRQRR